MLFVIIPAYFTPANAGQTTSVLVSSFIEGANENFLHKDHFFTGCNLKMEIRACLSNYYINTISLLLFKVYVRNVPCQRGMV